MAKWFRWWYLSKRKSPSKEKWIKNVFQHVISSSKNLVRKAWLEIVFAYPRGGQIFHG